MPETHPEQTTTDLSSDTPNRTRGHYESAQPGQSRKSEKTPWLVALASTLALHGGIVAAVKIDAEDIEKAAQTISFLAQASAKKIKNALIEFAQSTAYGVKRIQLKAWEEALEKDPALPGFDYGDFFLRLSWLEGWISYESLEKDRQKIAGFISQYKKAQEKQSETIRKMIDEQFGAYDEHSAQLHTLLSKNKGNCEARTQMMISLIKGVYGDKVPIKIRISRQKLEDGKEQLHGDLFVKIDDKWHLAAPGLPEAKPENLEGTAVFEASDYVKKYLRKRGGKPNIVKEGETPNENNLDTLITDSIVDLAEEVDAEKLKTHDENSPEKTSKPENGNKPIEISVIPADSKETDTIKAKRQFTKQEVVDAELTGEATITPEIETLEPLRGVKLKRILISNPADTSQPEKYPSFEPLAKTPPKEILISQASSYDVQGQSQPKNTQVPDLSPLHGKTTIAEMAIVTKDLQEWEKILENFEIQEAMIYVLSYQNNKLAQLGPLKKTRVTKTLALVIAAAEGEMDMSEIASLPIIPQKLGLRIVGGNNQKFTNVAALGKVPFTLFETSDIMLDEVAPEGVIIQANAVMLVVTSVAPDRPYKTKYLKDLFRTQQVVLLVSETRPPGLSLEPFRGMPALDTLEIEMEDHVDLTKKFKPSESVGKYGHMSNHEIHTGEKPRLDLSALGGTPVKKLLICGGFKMPEAIPKSIAQVVILDSKADPVAVEKWRAHLRTLPDGDLVPPPPQNTPPPPTQPSSRARTSPPASPPPEDPPAQETFPIPETLQDWLKIPRL